jgi:RNA polymerase sigma-70 factor, ECF subfamily
MSAAPFADTPCAEMDLDSSSNFKTSTGNSDAVTSMFPAALPGSSNAGISCKLRTTRSRSSPVSESNHERRDAGPAGTLGDLLYADRSKPRIAEQEWRELLAAVAAGDQLALQALYDRTHRLVFTLTMRILGNSASAEEVTLDVFHDIWRRASTYDGAGGSVLGWIMNQAHSRAIDRLRFEGRKKRTHSAAADPQTQPPPAESAAESSEQGRLLQHALQVLTPDERRAIEVAYFSDLTYVEVAARLKQPLGTIKTRIRSALVKLRRALSTGVETG